MPFGIHYVTCQKGIVCITTAHWRRTYRNCLVLSPIFTDETHNVCLDLMNVMHLAQWFDDLVSPDCISMCFEKDSTGWSCVEPSDVAKNTFLNKEFPFDNEHPDTDYFGADAAICVGATPNINSLGFPYYEITIRSTRPDPLIYPEDDPSHFEIECTFANIKTFSKLFYIGLSNHPSYVFMDDCEDEIRKLKETIRSMKQTLQRIEERQQPDCEKDDEDVSDEDDMSEDLPEDEVVGDEVVSHNNGAHDIFKYFITSYDKYDLDEGKLADARNTIHNSLQIIKSAIKVACEASEIVKQYNIFRDLFNDGKYSCNSLLNKFRHRESSNTPVTTVLNMASILAAAYFYKLENKTYTPENPEAIETKLYKLDDTTEGYVSDVYAEAVNSLGIMYDQPEGICFTNDVMKEDYENFKSIIFHFLTFSFCDDDKYKELEYVEKYVCSGNYRFSFLSSYPMRMTIKEEMALVLALRDMYFMLTFAESEFTPFLKSERAAESNTIMIDLVRAILINVAMNTEYKTTKGCYKTAVLNFEECVRAFYNDSNDALDLYNSALVELFAYESVVDKAPKNEIKQGFPVDYHYD